MGFRATQALVVCGALLLGATQAHAAWPDKPVHFMVGSTPGTGGDTLTRLLAAKLSEKWGQPVVVENHAGASGTIAESITAHAAPDGYTLIVVNANHTTVPSQLKLDYDPVKGFAPISLLVSQPDVLMTLKSLPVTNAKELIALAKAKPGQLNFGSSGIGGAPYLEMAEFAYRSGMKIVNVSYKGVPEALVGLLGGEVQLLFGSVPDALVHMKEGNASKVNVLAVSTGYRVPSIPEIPTIAEAADLPDFNVSGWQGALAPAGTPKEIVAKIHDDLVAILKSSEVTSILARRGNVLIANTPDEFQAFIDKEIPEWATLLKSIDTK